MTCLTFDLQTVEIVGENGVSVTSGSHDPVTAYKRGIWFDGDSYIVLEGLILHHTFTLSFWVRVTNDGNLFSVNKQGEAVAGDEDFFNIKVESGNLRIEYVDAGLNYVSTSPAYVTDEWHFIATSFSWNSSGAETVVSLLKDGKTIDETQFNTPYIDSPGARKLLGAEEDIANGVYEFSNKYVGFIW